VTPPTVQFIPAPAAGLGDMIVLDAYVSTGVGGVENAVFIDGSTSVYNSWSFTRMEFRDATKNGSWTDDGLGLLWNMTDATNYANWQGYIGTAGGTFYVYEEGTSTLIFSFAWDGEAQWAPNNRRYGTTSVDYTGTVAANLTRVDVYHISN
jgi:hypothetical protein